MNYSHEYNTEMENHEPICEGTSTETKKEFYTDCSEGSNIVSETVFRSKEQRSWTVREKHQETGNWEIFWQYVRSQVNVV